MSKAVQDRNQTTPDWPTMIRSKLTDGRLLGVDNSLWLYRTVPMAPVAEARTPQEGVATSAPIMLAMDELASLTPVRMARRAAARAGYRETHILLVNLPQRFVPPADHPNADYLATSFPNTPTDRRVLLFGVRLASKVGGEGGVRRAVDSVVETLVMGGTPLSDYEPDYQAVSAALARCGLRAPSGEEIRLASAWWNEGNAPDTPMLSQVEALHVFTTAEAARAAKRAGPDADLSDLGAGHHTITFASVSDLDLPFVSPTDPRAHWASQLVDQGALAISVRGKVEPSKVTRGELRRQRKRYIDDMRERAGAGLMDRTEQSEQEQLLAEVEAVYATGGPPTLIETSIVVGFNGYVPDMPELSRDLTATLLPMWYRQRTAMAETMLCSAVRANPHLQDLPSQSIAASGLPSLSSVGDKTGALLGFTESDRQPVWVDAMAATDQDSLPYLLVAGATGSGKSVLMLWLASQMAKMPSKARKGANTPVIIIDPKTASEHDASVLEAGGQVASLDDLVSSDGIYDPIRFSANAEVGVELAASMLMSINPWGSKRDDYEAPLQYALHYGVSRGATCIGQALWTARQEGHADPVMVDAAFRLAQSSAMFRACFGINPTTTGLRVADGITLIKVGNAHLVLPEPGAVNPPLPQRVALALVRMMVYGSAMALADRDGVVMLDEAWVFMSAGREEMERLGRLARAMRVLPVMLTQRVSDAVNAGLSGYISRGLIGHLSDPVEAEAACLAFKLEPTPERMGRIMASDVIGSGDSIAPNFNSLRALVDRNTRQVYRGAVWIHCDTSGRSVPVEVSLPPAFLKRASTNAAEIRARKAVMDRGPAAEQDADLEPAAPPVQVKAARPLPAPYTQAGFSSDTPFPIPASGGPQPAADLVAASG